MALVRGNELVRGGDGRAEVVPREPVKYLSVRQAAGMLGLSEWSVADPFRLGLLNGDKPGAKRRRKDGKASNARLRLDTASVLLRLEAAQGSAGGPEVEARR